VAEKVTGCPTKSPNGEADTVIEQTRGSMERLLIMGLGCGRSAFALWLGGDVVVVVTPARMEVDDSGSEATGTAVFAGSSIAGTTGEGAIDADGGTIVAPSGVSR
jgi:hypothetical protein